MKEEIRDEKRLELFEYYNERENPFTIVTTKIDITPLYHKGTSMYATIAYYIARAVNEIDEFKYRYENGSIYMYDRVNISFTDMLEDKSLGFFTCPFRNNYQAFLEEYHDTRNLFLQRKELDVEYEQNQIWVSCAPWFHFTSLIPPFDKSITIPQFIWDKFEFDDDRICTNLMIMVHHGFADGYHIGLFINKLNELIKEDE